MSEYLRQRVQRAKLQPERELPGVFPSVLCCGETCKEIQCEHHFEEGIVDELVTTGSP